MLFLTLWACADLELGYPIPEPPSEEPLFDEDWSEACLEEQEPNNLSFDPPTDYDYLGLLSAQRPLSWCGSTEDDDLDTFVFEVRERGTVTLSLDATDFDAVLQLQDWEGNVLGDGDFVSERLDAGYYIGFVYMNDWGGADYALALDFE